MSVAAPSSPEPLARHLRRAGELIGARRLPEGELEVLKALELAPRDLRALKVLALVRFRLGRAGEARQTYRTAREAAPDDPAVRLGLALIALKLEWFEEAVTELEIATRLAPGDTRAWRFLGYAYSRTGSPVRAAAAFRRAEQPEAVEPSPPPPSAPLTATGFAHDRLVSDTGDVFPLVVAGEAHARKAAVMATVGTLQVGTARRRFRGRLTDAVLGGQEDPFVRGVGSGALWLSRARGLLALTLEDDIVYLREERVLGWSGELTWEAGALPGGPALLQLRGSGRVVIEGARPSDVAALRVVEPDLVTVPTVRLLGWLGRLVCRAAGQDEVACEGEGVLLLSKHGHAAQRVHQRAEPGDDGAGAARSDRASLHR